MTLSKDDFPIGTRVRVTDFQFEETNPQNGTTGTVLPADDFKFVNVRRDGKDADDEFPFRPSELEIIASEIAVGTRVRLDDSGHWSRFAAGKTATVAKVTPEGEIKLHMDSEDFWQWTTVDEPHFTILAPEPATPDLADALRERAALLTDDLVALNSDIDDLSAKRDSLRQDIAALKNAAARLEAQQ